MTPTKSQLGPTSSFDNGSRYGNSQIPDLGKVYLSQVLFSQKSTKRMKEIVGIFNFSAPNSRVVKSQSSGKISLNTYQNFIMNGGMEKPKSKIPEYTLSLITCKSHEVKTFRMYNQKDLNFSDKICEQIHHAVSFKLKSYSYFCYYF